MVHEREALLEAVLRHPDESAPREAYARWLDARGDPRGRFILVQIAKAEIERVGNQGPAWLEAYTQSEALLRAHRAEWEAPLAGRVLAMNFERGFVEEITLDARVFLDTAPELYALAPIRHVNLRDARGLTAELAASSHLDRVVSLSLWCNGIGDAGVRDLVGSPHLARLAWLDLTYNEVSEAGLEALAASKHLPNLRSLGFVGNRAPDPAEEAMRDVDGTILDIVETDLGRRLEARFGKKAWLHPYTWTPPAPDRRSGF